MLFKKKSYEELKNKYKEEYNKEKKNNELVNLKEKIRNLKKDTFNKSLKGRILNNFNTKKTQTNFLDEGLGMDPLGLNKTRNKKNRKPWDFN